MGVRGLERLANAHAKSKTTLTNRDTLTSIAVGFSLLIYALIGAAIVLGWFFWRE